MPASLQGILENVMPCNIGAAGGRGHKAGENAHRGAFSGSVWAQKPDNLPFFNFETQIVDGDHSWIFFGELFNFDHSIRLQKASSFYTPLPLGKAGSQRSDGRLP